jgi:carboxymethylenebutenolidase
MTIALKHPDGPAPEDFHLTRRGLAGAFFAGYAATALSADAEPIHTDEAGLVVEIARYRSQGFDLPAYVARPKAKGRFPVVIVVNEIFGIHDYIKDVCRRLAKLGYAAIAPAFFVRAGDPASLTDIQAVIKIVQQASDPQVMGDVGATLDFVDRQPWADARHIAITGFCWGGRVVWLACEQFPRIKAGVAWYGQMGPAANSKPTPGRMWPIDNVSHLTAPVLGLYGAKDALSALAPAMREALAKGGKSTSEIIVYPDAGHGFHADYRDSYVKADADDGWARMLAHFSKFGVAPRPARAA